MTNKNKSPKSYIIYVEGGRHDEVKTFRQADRIAKQARSEGWNVKVIAQYETVLGLIGVEV